MKMQGRKNNFPWFKYYNNYNLDTSKMENSIYDTLKKSVQKKKGKFGFLRIRACWGKMYHHIYEIYDAE